MPVNHFLTLNPKFLALVCDITGTPYKRFSFASGTMLISTIEKTQGTLPCNSSRKTLSFQLWSSFLIIQHGSLVTLMDQLQSASLSSHTLPTQWPTSCDLCPLASFSGCGGCLLLPSLKTSEPQSWEDPLLSYCSYIVNSPHPRYCNYLF